MTPKEKAAELLARYLDDKCFNGNYGEDYNAKQCAIICVDEILQIDLPGYPSQSEADEHWGYWQQVKQEIELL